MCTESGYKTTDAQMLEQITINIFEQCMFDIFIAKNFIEIGRRLLYENAGRI